MKFILQDDNHAKKNNNNKNEDVVNRHHFPFPGRYHFKKKDDGEILLS